MGKGEESLLIHSCLFANAHEREFLKGIYELEF